MVSGERDWTRTLAIGVLDSLPPSPAALPAIWLSDGERPDIRADSTPETMLRILPLRSATGLIGGETDLLIYDAWSGFDPDGFGAATGTLRGGGLLLLLTPPIQDWPNLTDPQSARIAVWPHGTETLSTRFIQRIVRVLSAHPDSILLAEDAPAPTLGLKEPIPDPHRSTHRSTRADPSQPATRDQEQAISAIVHLARGRAHRPLVLQAHRGRGKSAALGIAAARLAQADSRRILVTGPSRAACEALLRHAASAWPQAHAQDGGLSNETSSIRFLPPDLLGEIRQESDLVLVDEAAAIPAPLLTRLLELYPRLAFATTVHGYEGTGRGFEVRFRHTLDQRTPGWRALTLETPIRWAPADPLESLVFRALLLDATPAQPPPGSRNTLSRLDRDSLAKDEATLSQLFGLLVLAHYQTRPLDLRMLLDGPNLRVYVLRRKDRIIATALAAAEGGMADVDLRHAIHQGERRPRGHLLPQTLSAHAGIEDAPALRYLRVVRIAVHPALARLGLGKRLLRGLQRDGRRDGFDLLGASFGATPELIAFWSACGYRPAQIGTSKNAASGEHALVMLRPLSPAGRGLAIRAERHLERRLPVLLPGPLRRLDPHVAAALAGALHARPPRRTSDGSDPTRDPYHEIDSFARGHRTLDAALPALAALTRWYLGPALRAEVIDPPDAALMMAATRQLRPIAELVQTFDARGRQTLIQRLRELVKRLITMALGSDG